MNDQGFDFHPPHQRREPKRFEPPPWEADAFQELQRKLGEEQAEEEIASAIESLEADGAEAPVPANPAVDAAREAQTVGAGWAAKPDEPVGEGGVDDRVVLEMLAGLAAEEPPATRGVWKVAIASALLLGALGLVLVIWGVAAVVGSKTTGVVGSFGGTVLLVFGAGFVAAALWLVVRTLRQRGVL